MNVLMLLIGAAAVAPPPAPSAPPPAVTAPVKHDLRCFLLYAAAVGGASTGREDSETKSVGSFGIMYFYGKLKAEAPTLDLLAALGDEERAMESDPNLKQSGAACDTEFQNAGSQLTDLGNRLQDLAPHPTPSS